MHPRMGFEDATALAHYLPSRHTSTRDLGIDAHEYSATVFAGKSMYCIRHRHIRCTKNIRKVIERTRALGCRHAQSRINCPRLSNPRQSIRRNGWICVVLTRILIPTVIQADASVNGKRGMVYAKNILPVTFYLPTSACFIIVFLPPRFRSRHLSFAFPLKNPLALIIQDKLSAYCSPFESLAADLQSSSFICRHFDLVCLEYGPVFRRALGPGTNRRSPLSMRRNDVSQGKRRGKELKNKIDFIVSSNRHIYLPICKRI
ncbi:hypothetical protein ACRALDRAFT_2045357 [Sodiomyces alcalophilus JCM 7366]|uniref:uncharacterized protein n=1 Tax=Sodiomyces alcalophilus JCM 7366 TaxID=591952 RepID=UPI0039B42485